jgi:enolase
MRIEAVRARRIWDSRGRPTVEVEVRLAGGACGRGVAPAGASRGSGEAIDLRDGGARFGGYGVDRVLAGVDGEIAHALRGRDAADQESIDAELARLDGTPGFSRLGGNATIATSLAVLHAAAACAGVPLWRHLAGAREVRLPLPQVQIFGGGAHAGGRIDLQDLLVMPLAASTFDEALAQVAEVYRAAGELMAARDRRAGVADEGGWWPEFAANEEALEALARAIERAGFRRDEMGIALDVAASEFGHDGRYRLGLERRELDTAAWLDVLTGWVRRYGIVSVEDPVAEDDAAGMRAFTAAVGDSVQVVGDDYLVTDATRIEAAAQSGACNAALLKPNQAGTVTAMRRAFEAAKRAGWATIVSARSGETEDVSIVHLAVGWDAGQLKVGSFARSERMAKWNEALRIEDALRPRARYAGRSALATRASSPRSQSTQSAAEK